MYARIVWELLADPLGSAEQSLRTSGAVGTALIHAERPTDRHEARSRLLRHAPTCLQIAILFHKLAAKTHSFSITKVTRIMPLKSIIVLYSKNDKKHINILRDPNTEPLYVLDWMLGASGSCGEEIGTLSLLGNEPQFFGRISHMPCARFAHRVIQTP